MIGAGEDGRDAIKQYVPLTDVEAKHVEQRYGDAVRERCSPQPFFELARIPKDGGFVVAINIWPFPGQAVGVRGSIDKSVEGSGMDAHLFPLRSGRSTTNILPEQLPMLMLPEVRRTMIMLAAIPQGEVVAVSHATYYENVMELRVVSVDGFANTVAFERSSTSGTWRLFVPLDQIESAWKEDTRWRVHLRGQIKSEGREMSYTFAADKRRYQA